MWSDEDADALQQLEALYQGADAIAVKKLSKNDRSWAWTPAQSHQAGIYVPMSFRGAFLPADAALAARDDKPHIRQAAIRTRWPGHHEALPMTYRRFTNKGTEAHLTVPPRAAFATLAPASFLVMARKHDAQGVFWECVTLDSQSSAYGVLERQFDLLPAFLDGVFAPPLQGQAPAGLVDAMDELIAEFVAAAHAGRLPALIQQYQQIPDSAAMTAQAQSAWLAADTRRTFDPFAGAPFLCSTPGNDLRELTTDIEFTIYRKHELRFRAAQALEIIFRDGLNPSTEQIVQRVVRHFIPLYQVMLNASQQRKTRVGAGFEAHIRRMLEAGRIPFAEQAVVSTRRPDFVLPSQPLYQQHSPHALVLAAKTTLRERWKQVPLEQRNCTIFLATMDEKVTQSAVQEMANLDIVLVVPEAFKAQGTVVEYAKESNVLTFQQFFQEEIAVRRKPRWMALGAW